MKVVTQEWLNRAKDDLDVTEEIIELPHLTNIVAFHSQQSIEKSFKAILEEYNENVPRIHSLVRLYALVKDKFKISVDELLLAEINDVYIDARYPGELGLLPYGKPSLKDSKKFYETAKHIYTEIVSFLSLK